MPTEIKLHKPGKGAPPALEDSSPNLAKPPGGSRVHQQVKISPETRRWFRSTSADQEFRDLGEFFEELCRFYREKHG